MVPNGIDQLRLAQPMPTGTAPQCHAQGRIWGYLLSFAAFPSFRTSLSRRPLKSQGRRKPLCEDAVPGMPLLASLPALPQCAQEDALNWNLPFGIFPLPGAGRRGLWEGSAGAGGGACIGLSHTSRRCQHPAASFREAPSHSSPFVLVLPACLAPLLHPPGPKEENRIQDKSKPLGYPPKCQAGCQRDTELGGWKSWSREWSREEPAHLDAAQPGDSSFTRWPKSPLSSFGDKTRGWHQGKAGGHSWGCCPQGELCQGCPLPVPVQQRRYLPAWLALGAHHSSGSLVSGVAPEPRGTCQPLSPLRALQGTERGTLLTPSSAAAPQGTSAALSFANPPGVHSIADPP